MENPQIIISLKKKAFAIEPVLTTCTELSDAGKSFFVRPSDDGKSYEVLVSLTGVAAHETQNEEALKLIVRDFEQSVFDNQIRLMIARNNTDNREQIVFNALSNPVFFAEEGKDDEIPESIRKILEEDPAESDESYLDDPLQIAVPWDENKT